MCLLIGYCVDIGIKFGVMKVLISNCYFFIRFVFYCDPIYC